MQVPVYRSTFRRRWYGVKLYDLPSDCAVFLIIRTARGVMPERRTTMKLHTGWLRKVGTIEVYANRFGTSLYTAPIVFK